MDNKKFIDDNFDLDTLLEIGFIKSKTDYDAIEKRVVTFFGLNNIFEYAQSEKPHVGIKAENIFSDN